MIQTVKAQVLIAGWFAAAVFVQPGRSLPDRLKKQWAV